MHTSSKTFGLLLALLAVCLFGQLAYAKYGGGSGTAYDPYQIATATDLIALGETPGDYDKHFILTDDIDLDPNLPGRKVFDKAVIGDAWPGFTGVFDGNGHKLYNYRGSGALFGRVAGSNAEIKNLGLIKPDVVGEYARSLLVRYLDDGTISNCDVEDCNLSSSEHGDAAGLVWSNNGTVTDCHVSGQINGTGHVVGGLVSSNEAGGTITRCSFSGTVGGGQWCGARCKGGLVGDNHGGISFCYSTGWVSGCSTGGLVGWNYGVVYSCYSTSDVQGKAIAGGLVGDNNSGTVSNCYSTGAVTGKWSTVTVGGLVAANWGGGSVTGCFWDTQTSGQASSAGGTGKTTAEMQMVKTFLEAGWDFVGETPNGTEDIWTICEGQDYPKLAWQFVMGDYNADGHIDFMDFCILAGRWLGNDSSFWCPGGGTDLTNDAFVDFEDLMELAENWLTDIPHR